MHCALGAVQHVALSIVLYTLWVTVNNALFHFTREAATVYVITVTFDVKLEHTTEFREAMIAQAQNSLARETGCMQFDVCADPGDAGRVFLYEIYADEAA